MWMAFGAWMVMAATASLVFQRKIEEALPFVMFACVTILFLFGIFDCLTVGLWVIGALTAAGAADIVFHRKWKTELIVTPGLLFMVVLFGLAAYLHQYRVVNDWDEIAQWALAPKNTFFLNKIPVPENSNMVYTSYPPGSSLYCYLWCRMAGAFEDSYLYTAMMFFHIGILAPVWKNFDWKKWPRILPCLFLILVAPRAFYTMSWDSLLIDYALGAVTVSLLYQYVTAKGELFDWLYAAVGLFTLVQLKETGLFFAVMYLAAVLIDQLPERKQLRSWLDAMRRSKMRMVACVFVTVLPFAGKGLWSWFLKKNGIGEFWGGGEKITLSLLNVFDRGNGVQPWQRTGFKNFWLSIFNHHFSSRTVFYVHNTEVPLIVWYVILVALTVLLCFLYKKQKRIRKLFVVLWAGNLIFTISLAYMYYLKLSEAENAVLAAYSRYISTVNSAIWLMVVLLIVQYLAACRWRVREIILIAVLMFLPRYTLSAFVVSAETREARIQAYEARQREYAKAEKLVEYIGDGTTIVFNGKSYLYNYLLTPVRFGGPFGDAVITDFSYFLGQVPYKKYVYFDDKAGDLITDEFREQYASHFYCEAGDVKEKIVNHGLYRALYRPDGSAVLEYITTIDTGE